MINLKNFFSKRISFVLLLLIFLASTWSLYNNQFFRVHDYTHGARIAEMALVLKEGRFPVRWSPNFGFGFGMPLFNFYAPLPYYVAALFYNLGFSLVFTIKFCLYLLPTFIALLGAFKLGKKHFGTLAGIILAAAFTLAPYRAVNLYVRGALSEIWAMAFLPWVLYAISNLANQIKNQQGQMKNYLLLILSLSGIILSHNLTALMFIPLSGFYAFIFYLKANNFNFRRSIARILPLTAAYLLSLLLTAFYVLPSFLEKDFTKIDFIFSGYFEYHHHFLYIRQFFQRNWAYGGSAWGPNDDISFFLGWGQLFALFSLSILLIKFIFSNKHQLKAVFSSKKFFYSLVFAFFSIFTLFMAIMKSKFIWDKLGILQYIQFPWRWLTVASVFIAFLAALSTTFLKKTVWRYLYVIILLITTLVNTIYFRPEKYLEDANSLYYSDPQLIQKEMSGVLPDYVPVQMADNEILKTISVDKDLVWLDAEDDLKLNYELLVDRSFEKLFNFQLDQETLINFKIAYFPGWKAEINGETTDIIVNPDIGNIQVLLPAGNSQLGIYFSEQTLPRKLGNSLSVLGLIIFFYYFSPFAEQKNKKPAKLKKSKD
jgi:hypothetical protein